HFVTKQLVRLKRHELRILDTRVLKLPPVVHNARHARQRAAHSFASLQTPNYNPVAIVVELTRSAQLERTEKRNRKRALVYDLRSFLTGGQTSRCAQRSHHNIFRRRARDLTGKMPEPATRVTSINTR